MSVVIAPATHSYGIRSRVQQLDSETPIAEGSGLSFKLLLVFLVLLYANLSLLVPMAEVVRPAQTIGGLALLLMIYEKLAAGQRIDLAPPDGWLLGGFVVAAGLSTFSAVWPAYAFDALMNLIK